ncbi:MAG: hypothetical protein OJF49_000782 [Ktedonobacterales bacterium]|jgi:RimJ/RimL family protein N-acetyltransferase|nr:MAG: hypothetical protein OJF49_000782 [Ktedonobacterales bacterium]
MDQQTSATTRGEVTLRDVAAGDLEVFFQQQRDPEATFMAAFTARDPEDRDAFMAHWNKIMGDDSITTQTILYGGQVAGSVSIYESELGPEITYWLGKEYWGKGIATAALAQFLVRIQTRPIHGRAAKDNIGSVRVLQKCGFTIVGEDRGYANARGAEIAEYVLILRATEPDKAQ